MPGPLVPYTTIEYVKRKAYKMALPDEFIAEDLIVAASRVIDRLTQSRDGYFEKAPTDPSTRTYLGSGTHVLVIDLFVGAINTIAYQDGSALPTYYISKNRYLLLEECNSWTAWSKIDISARWGFEEIPADIGDAAAELVIVAWRERDPAYLRIIAETNPSVGSISGLGVPPRVREVCKEWRKKVPPFVS